MQVMMQMMQRCMMGGPRQPEEESSIQLLPRRGGKPKAMMALDNKVPERPPPMPPPALQAEEPLLRTPSGEAASVEEGVDEAEEEGGEIGEECDAAVAPGPKRKASAIHDLDILIGAMDGRAAEQKAKKAGAKAKAKAAAKAEASTGDDDGGDEAGEEAAPKKAVVPKKAAKKDGPSSTCRRRRTKPVSLVMGRSLRDSPSGRASSTTRCRRLSWQPSAGRVRSAKRRYDVDRGHVRERTW